MVRNKEGRKEGRKGRKGSERKEIFVLVGGGKKREGEVEPKKKS